MVFNKPETGGYGMKDRVVIPMNSASLLTVI